MRDLTAALNSLYPKASWTLNGEEYNGLIWHDDNDVPKPSQKELEDECDRLEQVWLNTKYQRQRATEYPPIGDQLDALFHAGVFPPEMAEKIQAIKNKYPKG